MAKNEFKDQMEALSKMLEKEDKSLSNDLREIPDLRDFLVDEHANEAHWPYVDAKHISGKITWK